MDACAVAHERWSPQEGSHLPPVLDILLPLAYTPDTSKAMMGGSEVLSITFAITLTIQSDTGMRS